MTDSLIGTVGRAVIQRKSTGELGTETVPIGEADEHRIRVRGTTGAGDTVVGETTVWTRDEPPESVLVDIPLDKASSWSGPWGTVGDEWPGELQEYRMVPNRGRAGEPVLIGGQFVDDGDRGRVLEVQSNEGLWVPGKNGAAGAGSANRTLSFAVKPDAVEGRQVLCVQGHANAGWNLYLDGDTLYGGGWGVKDKFGNWKNWISGGSVTAGEWHEVALVLEGASSEELTGDALSLYLDGERVANGAARTLSGTFWAPRLGSAYANTHYHDGRGYDGDLGFSGRFSDFLQSTDARPPE